MRKFLAGLTAIGLLGAFLVLVAQPASAATVRFGAVNDGDAALNITAESSCSTEEVTVAAQTTGELYLDTGCNYTVYATDAAGLCTVEGKRYRSDPWSTAGFKVQVDVSADGADPMEWGFRTTDDCIADTATLQIEKEVPETDRDEFAADLTTFTFVVTPFDLENSASLDDGGPCSDSSTHSVLGATDAGDPFEDNDDNPDDNDIEVEVVNGYIAENFISFCSYAVTEVVPTGWTLTGVDDDEGCNGPGIELLDEATVIVTPAFDEGDDGPCGVDFDNELDPLPLTITKTFTGRDFYTTVDRADFHLFTPGECGTLPIDPFGGLLGSVGVFRTINASQLPQVVLALPDTPAAGPNGACTYRVQESGAPDGCEALEPDGSDADGPYWEQTWIPGETTEFTFNIVNDCSKPDPTPDPRPQPSPTVDPKKSPAKKGPGGAAAPKFTG